MRNATWALLAVFIAGCMSHQNVGDTSSLNAGYAALNQQDYNGAMAQSEKFLREHPEGGPGTAEALYLQGRVLEKKAETADAAHHEPEAHSELQNARQTYEHALTLSPPPSVAALLHAGVANCAYFEEDYFTAMREWASAYPGLTQPDARAWVLYRLGLCQQRLGRFDEADRSFASVRQQFPQSEPAQRAAAHQGARAFYVQVGSFADAPGADRAVAALKAQGFTAAKNIDPNGRQSIRVGPTYNYDQAKALRVRLLAAYPAAVIEP